MSSNAIKCQNCPLVQRDTGYVGVWLVLTFFLTFFFGLVFKHANIQ